MIGDPSLIDGSLAREDLLGILDAAETAFWVYDIDKKRIEWANQAGLNVWEATSLEDLRERDLSVDMSRSVEQRLLQYQEDFTARDARYFESWTLYPFGKPRTLRVKYSGFRLADGRMAMLCQAAEPERAAPETVRSIEVLLHTSVMISMFSNAGRQLYCNPSARAAYGTSNSAFSERFVVPGDYADFAARLEADGHADVTVQVRTVHGLRWHHVLGLQCRDAVTGEMAVAVSETDVSEMERTKAALEVSRNEALEANRLKSEFLANMSHEIRTPLNGVLGMAQLLQKTRLSGQQAEMIDVILASGEALLALISDVLDISKIEAGLVQVDKKVFSVDRLLESTLSALQGAARVKGLDLVTESNLAHGRSFVGDVNLIRQVLMNLAGNAIKFCDRGTITIAVKTDIATGIRFSVTDEGPGIAREQQALIFDRFRQADGSATRQHGGTGLGLSIAKNLVAIMGGDIGVDSTLGQGSQFWFTLPWEQGEGSDADGMPGGAAEAVSNDRAAGSRNGTVLVVEDHEANRLIACTALDMAGFRTISARNGAEALVHLHASDVDLVLLDLHMPDMTGTEVLQEIRAENAGFHDVPVVIMTADVTPDARIGALRAGASHFLTKPLIIDNMIDIVTQTLGRPGADPRGARPAF